MKRAEKEAFVEEFRDRVQEAPAFYLTDFTGLDVQSMNELRRALRESGAEYMVVKNRLALRALKGTEAPDLKDYFSGPTGVVLSRDGVVEPAKALRDFAKDHNERPQFKIGVMENQLVDADQFKRLADLPTRDELLAQLAGALQAPLAQTVGVLEGKLQEAAGLFQALREQREAEG